MRRRQSLAAKGRCIKIGNVASSVNFSAVTDLGNRHADCAIFDLTDNSIISDSILPQLAEARPAQGFADATRIFESADAPLQETENTFANVPVQPFEIPARPTR